MVTFLIGVLLSSSVQLDALPEREVISKIIPPVMTEVSSVSSPSIEAKAYVVGDARTGQVLLEHEGETPLPMASLTKIMTAIVALEHYDSEELVRVSKHAADVDGSKVNIYAGEFLTVEDLVAASMIRSGNDAAIALGEHAPGGMDQFMGWMNQKALNLGLSLSSFENPIGFDGTEQFATAKDLFTLARYAYNTHEEIRDMVGESNIFISSASGRNYQVSSTNALLGNYFIDILGFKTGTTDLAGQSFVGLARLENGSEVFVVLLNSPDRFKEAKVLFWWLNELLTKA